MLAKSAHRSVVALRASFRPPLDASLEEFVS